MKGREWLSEEDYRAFKKNKTAKQRGVKANARDRARAELKKAGEVLSHEENPVDHLLLGLPKEKHRTFPVTIKSADGKVKVVSDYRARHPEKLEPKWAEKAKGEKTRKW